MGRRCRIGLAKAQGEEAGTGEVVGLVLESPCSTTYKQLYLWMFLNVNDKGGHQRRSLSNIGNNPKPVRFTCLLRAFIKLYNSDCSRLFFFLSPVF